MSKPVRTFIARAAGAAAAVAFTFAAVSCATSAPRGEATIGPWGVDLTQIDPAVSPGDDFYRYVNGRWLATFQIPPDRTNYGAFTVLAERAEQDVLQIIEDSAAANAAAGSPEQKIGDLYASFMDEATVAARGLEPLKDGLDQIAAAETHEDILRVMARPDLASAGPVGGGVDVDFMHPDTYVFYMTHGGLGLPDRDYYLVDDERYSALRTEYAAHIGRMLTLAGLSDGDERADRIVALETRIAEAHWERARRRDRDLTYNRMTVDELVDYAPGLDWKLLFNESGLGGMTELVAREKDAFPKLAQIFADTPVDTWKDYLTFHVLSAHAPYLPPAFEEEDFAFFGRTLSGQPQQRDRWRRGVDLVNGAIGMEVGKVYVERHFPPEAKVEMERLVDNLKAALAARIETLDWMTPETKAQALDKLSEFTTKIGYPDEWEDYSALTIVRDDLVGNVRRANEWAWNDMVEKLGGPIDPHEWEMTPQTVNAYYSPNRNEIVFPAAILQAPFFDVNADPAVNYGAIGAVIGHEIGHGFDDQGRKTDGQGMLRDWWTDADAAAFEAKAEALGGQYGSYEPLPGYRVNPELTMGENIGDLGGVSMALEAYHRSLRRRTPPALDGFTGDQRFFMGWGQIWARKYRDEELINRLSTDPHSPSEYRANGVVRNVDAWYEAFGVQPGGALYLPPESRVSIW
jgi:predicted metalloendopeptidase